MKLNKLLLISTILLVSCLIRCVSVYGQTATTGALTVGVTDPTGAVIVGASVAVTNTATHQSRTELTETNGSYTFSLLPVGTYQVTVGAAGFQTAQIPSVAVNVTETKVLNQQLAVGSSTQEITVHTEAETVQTESSTLGGVVNNQSINALPLVTRNYTQVLSLSPGTSADVVNASKLGHGTPDMYVNGNANTSNNFQMDGAQINSLASSVGQDIATTYGSIAIPNPDAIEEFKVQTSMYDASYGRSAGGNVNVVTKSGTNSLHGSAFEFLRNDDLNANDYFRNSAGLGRAELKQNQFGGSLGGPFIKDKLFFFGSYQGTRQVNGVDTTGSSTVLLPPQLSNTSRLTAASLGAAFCPGNSPAGDIWTNTRFGSTTGPLSATDEVQCNGSNINPVALALLNTKLPNGSYAIPSAIPSDIINSGTANASSRIPYTIPSTYNEKQFIGNLDYVISSKNTLAARYFYAIAPEILGFDCQPCLPGSSGDLYNTGNQNETVKLTSLLTNNFVNEARFSASYLRANDVETDPLTTTEIGMTAAQNVYFVQPVITIGSFLFGGATTSGKAEPQTTIQWADQISWSHGRHTIRAGYEQERLFWLDSNFGLRRGSIGYLTFADFLVGLPAAQNGTAFSNVNSSSATLGTPTTKFRANAEDVFVQDDIKVNRRLTLNLGLRWEYDGLIYDSLGDTFAEWLSLYQTVPVPPSTGTYVGLTMPPNYPGSLPAGILRRSTNVQTENGSPKDDFAPRVGFAWQPLDATGKFVVRAGYGWFYNRVGANEMAAESALGPPIATPINLSGATNTTASDQNPFPPTVPVGFTPFLRTPTSKIAYSFGIFDKLSPPLLQSYNLGIQYALRPSWVLEVGYAGSRGTHLATLEKFNEPVLATATTGVNCGVFSAACITTNTSANAPQRVPIVGISPGGLPLEGNFGDSNFNSLEVQLRKVFSQGLQFQIAYTYGKTLDDFEAPTSGNGTGFNLRSSGGDIDSNDPLNHAQEYGPADWNRLHRLVANYLYQFPQFQQNKGLAGRALSGWAVSGVTTVQTGQPLTITDSQGGLVYGSVGNSRAQLCPGFTQAQILTTGSIQSRLNGYFNSLAVSDNTVHGSVSCTIPVVGQINGVGGATGYGNLGRGIAIGPGQFNWDMAVTKMTRVGGVREDANLEFRAEFFNAFNHPQFANPGIATNSATFGVISSASVSPRIIQLALRYSF